MDLNAEFIRALRDVQDAYGDRDKRWTPGVAFCKRAFTGTKGDPNDWNVMAFVLERKNDKDTDDFMRFDVLHESTHVLNPTRDYTKHISYLEEGAATLISLSAEDFKSPDFASRQRKGLAAAAAGTVEARYHEGLTALEALTKEPLEFIKAFRGAKLRSLSMNVVEDDILAFFPNEKDAARLLCRKFYLDPFPITT